VIKLGPYAEATTSIGERRTNLCQSIWDKSEVLLGTLCYLLASKNTLPISFKEDESEQSIWDKVSAIENMLENALGTKKNLTPPPPVL